jgi:hypothetical protein
VSGATSATLTISNAQSSDAGTYAVTVANSAGSVSSASATLTVNAAAPANIAPTITTQPVGATVTVGGNAAFSVVAAGTPAPTYQWTKGGSAIAGGTSASLTLSNVQASAAGVYAVTVSNSVGSVTSSNATLTVTTVAPSRIANISGRAAIGGGNNALIVAATFNAASKSLVFRLAGPALKPYGLANAINAPRLQLLANGILTTTNTSWDGLASSSNAFAQVGAFPFSAGSKDAAIINSFGPGSYVLVGTNVDGVTGSGLGEIYDASTSVSLTERITNVSVRGQVSSGDNILIAGFVISGAQSLPVVIRGVGPALTTFGLTGVADPTLTLFSGNSIVATNSGWDGSPATAATFVKAGAFPLPTGSKDAAVITTLQPGAYTVQVSSASGGSGSALIEIYDVQ